MIGQHRRALGAQARMLKSLSYQSVLGRGYAVVRNQDRKLLARADQVLSGEMIGIEFADGEVSANRTRCSARWQGARFRTGGNGICHAYAPDGRCISLLKILMTNFCIYDCAYCINRVSSNVPRARFSVDEVVRLTIDFYRRNYIEGLFLSSGVIRSPDATMSDMVQIVRKLREEESFRGYIHLKTIPDAAPELIEEAGRLADRLSINVELPTDASMETFASEKNPAQIRRAMAAMCGCARKRPASGHTQGGKLRASRLPGSRPR
jgi:predicted DNA-binding helix-hairpin-helix protein